METDATDRQEQQPLDQETSHHPSELGSGQAKVSESFLLPTSTALGDSLRTLMLKKQQEFSEEVRALGDPGAWLRKSAPHVLPLFPEGVPAEVLLNETPELWQSVSERVASCGRCPPEGGACEGSKLAMPDGFFVERSGAEIAFRKCSRWSEHLYRSTLIAANVPAHLAGTRLASLRLTDAAVAEIEKFVKRTAERSDSPSWLVVSGGAPRRRAEILVAILQRVARVMRGGTAWFDWCPRLAVVARVYLDDRSRSGEDPRLRLRQTSVLALDFVDPTRWQPWFTESMDELLYARSGLTTLLGTGLGRDKLSAELVLSGQCIEGATFINAGEVSG